MKRLGLFAVPLVVAACTQAGTAPPAPTVATVTPRTEAPQPSVQVRQAQQQLRTLGLYDGPVDGLWGPTTQTAVERFQRNRGLDATGRLDRSTMAAIDEAAAAPIALSDPTQVRTVQNRLRQLNFYDGAADGIWGSKTQVALERFQRARDLPVGQVTRQTLAAMELDPAAFPTTRAAAPGPIPAGEALDREVVRGIQQRLRQQGFYRGRNDGIWGPATQDAVVRFQRSRGLEATGTLNPTTASALGLDPNNLSASAVPPPALQAPSIRR